MRKEKYKASGVLLLLIIVLAFSIPGHMVDAQEAKKETNKSGERIYLENCLACHQANGSGVPRMAPPLKNVSYVIGDKAKLINIVLKGFDEEVEIEGEYYSNPMPGFPQLTDVEVANVLTYIRSNFGNNAEPILPREVAVERSK